MASKGENAPAFLRQKEWVCSGYMDGLQLFFLSDIVKVFPNVKYKKNNESKSRFKSQIAAFYVN
jgi:hypothetical protein